MTETDNRLKMTEVRISKPVTYLFVFFLSVFCSLSSLVYSLTSDFSGIQ